MFRALSKGTPNQALDFGFLYPVPVGVAVILVIAAILGLEPYDGVVVPVGMAGIATGIIVLDEDA
jgi:hypothetical protein